MFFRFLSLCLAFTLVSCESTVPSADQLDVLEAKVRAEMQPEFANLEQMRSSGRLNAYEYAQERDALNQKVQNKVDSMLWSRHALAQSERKANGLPTPDQPVSITPPGVGTVQGSLYTSSRINGLGNQAQGNFMRDLGNANFNQGRAGTAYDPQ